MWIIDCSCQGNPDTARPTKFSARGGYNINPFNNRIAADLPLPDVQEDLITYAAQAAPFL